MMKLIEEPEEEELISDYSQFVRVKQQDASFAQYSSKVNWLVFGLICIFTLG